MIKIEETHIKRRQNEIGTMLQSTKDDYTDILHDRDERDRSERSDGSDVI